MLFAAVLLFVALLVLHLAGHLLFRLLSIGPKAPPFEMLAALSLSFPVVFYGERLDIAPRAAIGSLLAIYVALAAIEGALALRSPVALKAMGKEVLKLLLSVALALCIIAIYTEGHPVSLGNNDYHNWLTIAGSIVGTSDLANAHPDGAAALASLRANTFATNWLLAAMVLPYDVPAEATNLIYMAITALIYLGTYSLLRLFAAVDPIASAVLACLLVVSPIFAYLLFNAFFAQLFATLGAMCLAASILFNDSDRQMGLWRRVATYFPGIVLIAGFYAAGSSAFFFIGFVLAGAMSLSAEQKRIAYWLRRFMIPLALAGTVTLLLLAPALEGLLRQSLAALTAPAGWPLSVPLAGLAFLPSVIAEETDVAYVVIAIASASILIAVRLIAGTDLAGAWWRELAATLRVSGQQRKMLAGFGLYLALLCMYLLWGVLSDESYKSWKFATYFALSLSFIPLTILYLCSAAWTGLLSRAGNNGILARLGAFCRSRPKGVATVLLLPTLVLSAVMSFATTWRHLSDWNEELLALKTLRSAIPKGAEVRLGTSSYGETMLAMEALSGGARIWPAAVTYLRPSEGLLVERGETPEREFALLRDDCLDFFAATGISPGRVVARSGQYALIEATRGGPPDSGYFCGLGDGVRLREGFSGLEPSGVWTDGTEATVELRLPEAAGDLQLFLQVSPFLPAGVSAQRVDFSVGGVELASETVGEDRLISIMVDQGLVGGQSSLAVRLSLPDATPPHDHGMGGDIRRLGLHVGAIGYNLRKR